MENILYDPDPTGGVLQLKARKMENWMAGAFDFWGCFLQFLVYALSRDYKQTLGIRFNDHLLSGFCFFLL